MKRAILTILVAGVAACGSGDDQNGRRSLGDEAGPATVPANVQAQLDSGNTAFRGGDIEAALEHYHQVTVLAPELPAGWFGVYLAETRLGHKAEADSAAMVVHRLAPELLQAGGAMGGHPGSQDTGSTPPMR